MRIHYLELQHFLEEIEQCPHIIGDRHYQVFISEPKLYSTMSEVNHRLRNTFIWDHLFTNTLFDDPLLSKIAAGARSMKTKLMAYASSQLPGSEFWEPEPDIQAVLSTIKPTNDICESILGLNDWISTSIPNLNQSTRSTLVTVKKNETMQWLKNLLKSSQDDITLLAMKSRRQVNLLQKEEQDDIQRKRQDKMKQSKKRRDVLDKKAAAEKEKLSGIHVINSVTELQQVLNDIDNDTTIN